MWFYLPTKSGLPWKVGMNWSSFRLKRKKLVANLPMKGLVKGQSIMNTFSGISWIQDGEQYKLFWGAVGSKPNSYILTANWDGRKLTGVDSFAFEAV